MDGNKLRRGGVKNSTGPNEKGVRFASVCFIFERRKDKTWKIAKKNGETRLLKNMFHERNGVDPLTRDNVVPSRGVAKAAGKAIGGYFLKKQMPPGKLQAIGLRGTRTSSLKHSVCWKGGLKGFSKRIICLVNMNELPLKHLFLERVTSGPAEERYRSEI